MDRRQNADRRLERNQPVTEIFAGTDFDRRHDESECQANPGQHCCKGCGRPMNETEIHIYRSL